MSRWWFIALLIVLVGCDKPNETSTTQKVTTGSSFAEFAKAADMQPEQTGQLADDFSFMLLDGREGKLSDERGKVVFLNFWATWCFPCKREMPDIAKLQEHMKGKPFRLLAVSSSQGVEKVAPFVRKNPYPFDFVLDPQSIISQLYLVDMLPTTLIIDKKGVIISKSIGPRAWSSPEFFRQMDSLVL